MKKQILLFVVIAVLAILSSCKEKIVITNPIASFTYTQETEFIPEAVDNGYYLGFTNTSTDTETYLWDFGDGESKSTINLYFDHEYENPGTYLVSLTAANKDGNSDQVSKSITVTGTSIEVSCFYQGTQSQVYDYIATIYESLNNFNDQELMLEQIVTNNGTVYFRNLIPGKTYYIRIYSNAISGTGHYNNLNSIINKIPESGRINFFSTSLEFYSK